MTHLISASLPVVASYDKIIIKKKKNKQTKQTGWLVQQQQFNILAEHYANKNNLVSANIPQMYSVHTVLMKSMKKSLIVFCEK